jgi:ATP-dependent helicase HrpB
MIRERSTVWDESGGRIVACEVERLWGLLLSSRNVLPDADESLAALLMAIRSDRSLGKLPWGNPERQFQARVALLRRSVTELDLPDLADESLSGCLEEWLTPALWGKRTIGDVAQIPLLHLLQGLCSWDQLRKIEEEVPSYLTVPSGSRITLDYLSGGPVLAVKLQELFGLAETPCIAFGRVPVLLHLLSPARRPIQITSDLRSFWDKTYPEVKKELKGRYPKHPWPDDPWNALPTRATNKSTS